jgi:(R,R)-butanediol dehydrogenase/meso-butanediol dehydrogenase/diacetyl reductase
MAGDPKRTPAGRVCAYDPAVTELMPAAVYVAIGETAVRDLPVPEPGPGEVLVEISHCGICGTDLHLVLEGYARPGSVLGHERSGVIARPGVGVDGWEPGTRVVLDPTPGCGRCRACLRGRPSVCLERDPVDLLEFRGAFTRYVVAPAARLLPIPEMLSTRAAALTEPTAIAMHCVTLSGVHPGDTVLVTGAGPVGLLIVAVLVARGITDVTVSEPAAARRERALAVGAARAIPPDDLPRAPMGRPVDQPFTFAFECSGHAGAAEAALDQLDFAGTLVFVGTGRESPRINHNRMIVMELTALGAYNYEADGFGPALAMLAGGKLPLDPLIEPVDVGLEGLDDTMRRLAAGELPGKVMVRPVASR